MTEILQSKEVLIVPLGLTQHRNSEHRRRETNTFVRTLSKGVAKNDSKFQLYLEIHNRII